MPWLILLYVVGFCRNFGGVTEVNASIRYLLTKNARFFEFSLAAVGNLGLPGMFSERANRIREDWWLFGTFLAIGPVFVGGLEVFTR